MHGDQYAGKSSAAKRQEMAEWLASHPGPFIASNQATNRVLELYERLGFTYDRPKGLKNCVMVKTVEPA